MEQWRKTSCAEPLPLGRRNNKRKLVVECCQNKPVVHVQQGVFRRPIDAAANLPCVRHVDSKICAKETGNMSWSLQNGIKVDAARSKLNLGAGGTSEHLEQKKLVTTSTKQKSEDGHPGSRVLENEDVKPEQQLASSNVQHDDDQAKYFREKNAQDREVKARSRVMKILHKFRDYCDKLSDMKRKKDILNEKEEEEEEEGHLRRVDLQSAKKVKRELGYSTGKQYIGKVPGVEIGDRFCYRMELHIVGLHRPPRSGIETMDYGGQKIATSIVVSGGYNDYWKDVNTLIYCGHGGGTYASGNQEQAEDQKLKGGNLALLNSKEAKNPVRVIRGAKKMKAYYDQFSTIYIYDGLYTVEDMWKIRDSVHHKTVFNFKLIKISGQT